MNENFDEVYELLQKSAAQGDAHANFGLGMFYADGYGVEQSDEVAYHYFLKAAELGHPEAQYHLGVCYEQGVGVSRMLAEAAKWWQKAAEQGHAKAQYNLGICYKYGDGVPQNAEEAVKWWHEATELGHVEACFNLATCYAEGDGVEQSVEEAFNLWEEIYELYMADLETGSSNVPQEIAISTMCNLGYCYLYGFGVKQNQIAAYIYIRGAAKAGNPDARKVLKEVWNEEPTDPLVDQATLQEILNSDLIKTEEAPSTP